jgi:hypothetical protein
VKTLEVELRREAVETATVDIEVEDDFDIDDTDAIAEEVERQTTPEWEEDDYDSSVENVKLIDPQDEPAETCCSSCNKAVSQAWKYCPHCGATVGLAVVG